MTLTPRSLSAYAALAAFACLLAAAEARADEPNRTVTVSAEASVEVKPDAASIMGGVSSEADTARAALDANTKSMSNLIDGLRAAGIEAKDIRTSNFSVQPRYESRRDGGPSELVGYRVENAVTVLVRDLPKLGEILDLMVSLGANQMQGMSFVVSDADARKDDARRQAIANALGRAKLYAAAAGAEVGEVVNIAEDVSDGGPRPLYRAATMAQAVPVEPGQQSLEARVTVTWKLK